MRYHARDPTCLQGPIARSTGATAKTLQPLSIARKVVERRSFLGFAAFAGFLRFVFFCPWSGSRILKDFSGGVCSLVVHLHRTSSVSLNSVIIF